MKNVKSILFGSLAALALAACSSDDNASDGGEKQLKDGGYVAINIVANNTPTRAMDGGFDVPSGSYTNENDVKEVLCLFYDNYGRFLSSEDPTLSWTATASDNPAVEKVSQVAVVLKGDAIAARQLIVVINPTDGIKTALNNKSLTDARAVVADYGAYNDGFVMTNSVYKDGSNEICPVRFTEANIQDTEDKAKNNPVTVYVERVLAKVCVDVSDIKCNSTEENQYDPATQTSTKIEIEPQYVSAAVVATGQKSYLLKNISGLPKSTWTTQWTSNWTDTNNKRSYWAVSPTGLEIKGYKSFTNMGTSRHAPTRAFTNNYVYYVQENTTDNHTKVLVAALLTNKATGDPISLAYWHANYFTEEGFLVYVAKMLKQAGVGYSKTTAAGTETGDYAAADLEYYSISDNSTKAYEVSVRIKESALTDKPYAEGAKTLADATLKNITDDPAWLWKDGMTYYYADIEHFGEENKPVYDTDGNVVKNDDGSDKTVVAPLCGIVRNHEYQVTINSISGLGTPVFDPDKVIVPEHPKDLHFYLAAKVNILKWKVVSQSVDLK